MTSISGYTELLQDAATGDLNAAQHHLVDAIDRNSERLTRTGQRPVDPREARAGAGSSSSTATSTSARW